MLVDINVTQLILDAEKDENVARAKDVLNKFKNDPDGLSWIENLLPSVLALAILGGSITFSIIPSVDDKNPPNQRWSPQDVRTYLSLAWLFFTLALGVSTVAQVVLAFHRPAIRLGFWNPENDGPEPNNASQIRNEYWYKAVKTMFCCFPLSLALQLLVLLAFFFLALVIVAYAEAVGWVAVALTGISIFGAVTVWLIQYGKKLCNCCSSP